MAICTRCKRAVSCSCELRGGLCSSCRNLVKRIKDNVTQYLY